MKKRMKKLREKKNVISIHVTITRKMNRYIIIICIALGALSCGNGKGDKVNEPYDGGHGIGIDTATVKEIQRYEDDMPDNGMSRYMENNDEEGWD